MKMAFVSRDDPYNVHLASGVPFHMRAEFERQGIQCEWIQGDRDLGVRVTEKYFRLRDRLGDRLGWAATDFLREPQIRKAYAANVSKQIRAMGPDFVFSPSSVPVAFLKCSQPIAFWPDATFGGMIGFYPEFTDLPPSMRAAGWATEDAALRNCTFSIYSSRWAADTAIKLHHANPATTNVILRGANMQAMPWEELAPKIKARSRTTCQLLFLGIAWKRKGGSIAVEVARELNARGLPTELTVVGSKPEIDGPLPSWLKPLGYISKSTAEGRGTIQGLLEQSHFLLVPSLAECSGIASAEASAFGLPALVSRVGGMPEAVLDGINGMTFDSPASPKAVADYVYEMFANRDVYESLAESSYRDFNNRLNWPVNIKKAITLMEQHIPVRSAVRSTPDRNQMRGGNGLSAMRAS